MTTVNLLSTYMESDVVKVQDLKQEQIILHYFFIPFSDYLSVCCVFVVFFSC